MKALISLAALALATSPAMAEDAAPAIEASLLAPALKVRDCGAAQAFYEGALGMRVLMSRDMASIHETMLAFAGTGHGPGVMLICPLGTGAAPLRGTGQSRLIVSIGNLDAVVARMDAAGMAHGKLHDPAPGIRVLDIADPDGNELELVQNSRQH